MRRLIPLLSACALFAAPVLAGARVFVYYPSLARPSAIQEALEKKCPGLEISVFGRLADLQARVEREPPQAIVAQAAVLAQFPAYRPRLQGLRDGAPTEDYVLLSLGRPVDVARLDSASVGVVGILERKQMDAFVASLLPAAPRVNRVTKVEDLLPLLLFQSVSAVLVSEATLREFRKKSQAKLVDVKLEKAKVGLVAAGIQAQAAGAEREILPALKTLDPGTLALLGVDGWR